MVIASTGDALPAPATTRRILVADDEPAFADATAALLTRAGFSCEVVASADGARAALDRSGYDILIADIYMSGNEDLALLRECHDRYPNLPIIVVTGAPSTPNAITAFRLGVVDFLTKPIDGHEALRAVHKALERADLLRAAQRLRDGLNECISGLDALKTVMDSPRAFPGGGSNGGPANSTVPREFKDDVYEALSTRELEVLRALVAGQRPDLIAKSLFISTHTVRNHLKSIYRKLDVHSHVELLAKVRAA